MRILIISFYYEPDLSAGSFRTTSFVKELKAHLASEDTVEIVTTLPNRYSSFAVEAKESESKDGLTIKRIPLPPHKSTFFDQSIGFFTYFCKTLSYLKGKRYDIVFATSSRLFSAFLGAIVAKQKRVPLYLDIRDIFVDTMASVFRNSKLRFLVPVLSLVERFTLSRADKINLVSGGFLPYFERKYKKPYSFYCNGVDDEFLHFDSDKLSNISLDRKLVFTYTGNIGEGQGLEKIVPKIAQKYRNIEFRIIGDGGRKNVLKRCISNLDNVRLLPPVPRKELIELYRQSDVLFLHLNNYDAFKKVLPSKIFEYAATYKPIVAGVDGYAREFLERYVSGCLIFKPCDFIDFDQQFASFFGEVSIEKRRDFIKTFSRQSIVSKMVQDFLEISQHNRSGDLPNQ